MKRLFIILLLSSVFLAVIVVAMRSLEEDQREAYIPEYERQIQGDMIESENKTFIREKFALDYERMLGIKSEKTLNEYYANRAYYGAPPFIPHPVEDERSMGQNDCLKCHQNGGWVQKYEAYSPVTPHPEMVNCRQCHVSIESRGNFVASHFQRGSKPDIKGNKALRSSPPTIPHELQMRENCLACHGGPSAPEEIRVSHPERINCRQCHVFEDNDPQNRSFTSNEFILP